MTAAPSRDTRGWQRPKQPPVIAGRVPPHDLEAEAAVISAVLLKRSALDEVLGMLKPEDFYSDANGTILEAAIDLASRGEPIDTVTVAGWLRDRERLASVGGAAYIARIVDETPAVHNVATHAMAIVRKARRRRVLAEAQTLIAEAYGDVGDEDEWLEAVDGRLAKAGAGTELRKILTIETALREVFQDLHQQLEDDAPVVGGRTGLRDLDDAIGPLREGRHTVIGGFWGDGKTALALQCAIATAMTTAPAPKPEGGKPEPATAVLVISVEMSAAELASRALFGNARVDGRKAMANRVRYISKDEWSSLSDSVNTLRHLPVYFDDRADMTPELIRASVRRHKAECARRGQALRLVVVDYIQLVDGSSSTKRNENREQEVSRVSRAMKKTAKGEGVHVLGLAQLNDDPNKRGKDERRPSSRDFRESKAIPQNADCVILIHNQAARERSKAVHRAGEPPPTDPEEVQLIVDKLRGGRTGTVKAVFWPQLTVFADAPSETKPAPDGRTFHRDGGWE